MFFSFSVCSPDVAVCWMMCGRIRLMDNIAYLKSSNNMVESASLAMKSLPTISVPFTAFLLSVIILILMLVMYRWMTD